MPDPSPPLPAPPLLEASAIRKRFGGVVALERGDFALRAGEVHVLIGSNGCGKSTLCKIAAGAVGPDAGRLLVDGREAAFASPRAAAAAGIGVFYQELSLVPQLTVAENILLGREPGRGFAGGFVDQGALRRRAEELIARFGDVCGPGFGPDAPAGELSADQRQIVEILKVLAQDARILIFDEATSSLDARQVAVFFDIVRRLKEEGRGIIFISHRMDEIFAIGDRVTVMRNGATVATLAIAGTSRDEILRHMVGAALTADFERPGRPPATGEPILSVRALSNDRLSGVSLELRRGEILGLGGLHGQGQSALLRALFGADLALSGTIEIGGKRAVPRRPADAIRRGIAYVSGDRGRHGVFPVRPIFENLVLASAARTRSPWVDRAGFIARVGPVLRRLKLKFPGFGAPVATLSGGNQQKVVIGRWLAAGPGILLLDDPTKGIDVETKHDLYRIMADLCAEGVGIILYSSEDEELLGNADRVLVFNGGRIVTELAGDRLTEFELYRAAYRAEAA
ncbi:MAG: sugar ABC transporter ATP-binding protein [Inquilinus sp.]|uniref:sugar ABC transporter ATP-binding protein n=1 Tax=Inquilinus sp. TaxID=1932117 RepID=UPI003F396B87